MSRPGTAAVLSFLIPGVGQIYNGDVLRALFWLIITPGLWIGSGGTLGWVCHIIAAYTAGNRAEELNGRRLLRSGF
jgi:TM2 domain-containing membrane protein YozV